ncbi:MAG: 3'(2'),5'-bisphosphate nucleotidase CysQ [Saprospiraceae bacterium]
MYNINLAKEVVKIAKKAGDAIMKIYDNSDNFQVKHKADESPLTIADQAANEIICHQLEKLVVKYPIISEENKSIDFEERKKYTHYWLVDPLDGTKEFIKRNGEFTVNIALIENQRPVLGVVYAPVLEEMYFAVKGEGAFLEKENRTIQLQVSNFSKKDKNLGVVCSRSHLNEATQNFVDELNEPELVAQGSSLKFLILAKGEAHLYPRLAPTMEWDTGAAQIVLEEAGGKVLHAETQQPLLYNKENLLNPHFVASGNLIPNQ